MVCSVRKASDRMSTWKISQMLNYHHSGGFNADIVFFAEKKKVLWVLHNSNGVAIAMAAFDEGYQDNCSPRYLALSQESFASPETVLGVLQEFVVWYNEGFDPSHEENFGQRDCILPGPAGYSWRPQEGEWQEGVYSIAFKTVNGFCYPELRGYSSMYSYPTFAWLTSCVKDKSLLEMLKPYSRLCEDKKFNAFDSFGFTREKTGVKHGVLLWE